MHLDSSVQRLASCQHSITVHWHHYYVEFQTLILSLKTLITTGPFPSALVTHFALLVSLLTNVANLWDSWKMSWLWRNELRFGTVFCHLWLRKMKTQPENEEKCRVLSQELAKKKKNVICDCDFYIKWILTICTSIRSHTTDDLFYN